MIRTSKLKDFLRKTDGVGTATSLFILIIAMMVGGIAIDYSNGVRTHARLQALADSAAISSAMYLNEPDRALNIAMEVVQENHRKGVTNGAEVDEDSIELGVWNLTTRQFQPDNFNPNAVRVTATNSDANNNGMGTYLLRLVGISSLNVRATAIGLRPPYPPCSGGGYFSRDRTLVNNSNRFSNGFCLHGDAGVTIHNTNIFDPGTTIGMPDLSDFIGNNNNHGAQEALKRRTHNFTLLDAMPDMLSAMQSGNRHAADLPDFIRSGPVQLNNINPNTNLTPGTLYIVSGNVNLGSNNFIEGVAIVAAGTIQVNSNVTVRNVILAANGAVTFNSNNTLGETEQAYCATGAYSTYILSRSNVTFGTNSTFRGVMMLADGAIDTGHNNDAADGIYAEAGGRITLGNANSNSACPDGLGRDLGPDNLNEVIPTMVF